MAIKAALLRWAMDDARVTEDRLARETGTSLSKVQNWLQGAEPTKGELERIAKALGRSPQFFFLREPPAASESSARFRRASDGDPKDPTAEITALRNARAAQRLGQWWAEVSGQPPIKLPPVQDGAGASDYAEQVRTWLGWTTQTQIKATSKTAAFKALRQAVENQGILVLLPDVGAGNCRGFSLPDRYAPTIAINYAWKLPSLRVYTLLHELAHLAKGAEVVCHSPNSREERWCDTFAAAFLMPADSVTSYFAYHKWDARSPRSLDQVRLTSNRFKASWQAVAIRLRELGLADQAFVDEVFASDGESSEKAGFVPGGQDTPTKRLDQYGLTYTRAVLALRERRQITEFDARRRLNVNQRELQTLSMRAQGAA